MALQLRARFKLLWIPLQRMGCKLLNFRFISSGNFGKKIDMNGTKTSGNSPPSNALMELLIGLKLGIPLAGFMVCLNLTKRWRNCRRILSDHNAPHGKHNRKLSSLTQQGSRRNFMVQVSSSICMAIIQPVFLASSIRHLRF